MLGVDDKLEGTLENLYLAISTVSTNDLSEFLSSQQLEGMRIATMYLSAGIIDCLTSLVEWVSPNGVMAGLGKVMDPPDFDSQMIQIRGRVGFYGAELTKITQALQLKVMRDKDDEAILDWIWPDPIINQKTEIASSTLVDGFLSLKNIRSGLALDLVH
jgi:hypothetical protein